jgi:hypothetical protein
LRCPGRLGVTHPLQQDQADQEERGEHQESGALIARRKVGGSAEENRAEYG